MKSLHFDEANNVFVAPKGMEESVFDLHVYKENTDDGVPIILSCWEPSEEEIQYILEHKKVWLWIYGVGMPPVSVDGRYPFKSVQPNPDYEEETKNA